MTELKQSWQCWHFLYCGEFVKTLVQFSNAYIYVNQSSVFDEYRRFFDLSHGIMISQICATRKSVIGLIQHGDTDR